MRIRCKLHCSVIGEQANLNAVYEGSPEAQAASENAIFGKATPAGWGKLGPEAAAALENRAHYYLDLDAQPEGFEGYILTRHVQRTFRGSIGADRVQYRFVAMTGDPVSLELIIENPTAIAALDRDTEYALGIRLAQAAPATGAA